MEVMIGTLIQMETRFRMDQMQIKIQMECQTSGTKMKEMMELWTLTISKWAAQSTIKYVVGQQAPKESAGHVVGPTHLDIICH